MQKLLTTREMAEYLRLREETILRKVRKGEIPAIRIGRCLRFPQELIEEWLREKAATEAKRS